MTQITGKQNKTGLKEAFLEQFEVFSQNGHAKNALHQIRKEALATFDQLGLPGRKNEEYKYTQISRVLEKHFDVNDSAYDYAISKEASEKIAQLIPKDLEANVLFFVNGKYAEEHSKIISSPEDIIIKPLSKAYKENTDLIEQYFSKQADIHTDAFVALNTAFASEGLFVHVPRGKAVETPVLAYFISDTTQDKMIAQPRNLYLIGENSQVNLTESFQGLGTNPAYHNVVSEIVLDKHAVANYHKLQADADKTYHTGTTQVLQAARSLFNATTVTLSGAMIRNNLNVVLDAEDCEAHMFGLYMLKGETHVDNHTAVDHKKPNCFSNELYKGIMDEKSKGVFNGKIYVRPGAQKTNAFQSNKNILLTNDASVDTKPQLEIWADDVKCSHGATTGQIDQEQLFYLMTRGLSKEQARGMLLKAFASDVVKHIKVEPVREQIDHVIAARLEK